MNAVVMINSLSVFSFDANRPLSMRQSSCLTQKLQLSCIIPPRLNPAQAMPDSPIVARCRLQPHPRQGSRLELALACLIARGHLLIEDVPGVGKTTLAHVLARLLGLHFQRIQFTSDLLPADILGVSVFDRNTAPSASTPVRCSRRCCWPTKSTARRRSTQSALLEAMEEHQVTARARPPAARTLLRHRHAEPGAPDRHLSAARIQLDRFLMRIEMGYPDPPPSARCWPAPTGAAAACRPRLGPHRPPRPGAAGRHPGGAASHRRSIACALPAECRRPHRRKSPPR
jgi:hypothetical protein